MSLNPAPDEIMHLPGQTSMATTLWTHEWMDTATGRVIVTTLEVDPWADPDDGSRRAQLAIDTGARDLAATVLSPAGARVLADQLVTWAAGR